MNALHDRIEQMADQLRDEFVEDAQDMLDRLDGMIVEAIDGRRDPGDLLMEARRITHTLKGSGTTHGFPDVSIIAMRAEDYLADLTLLDESHRADIQAFTDALRRALSGETIDATSMKAEVRQLPTRCSFEVGDVEVTEVEVLLVSAAKVLAHKVRNELQACGYRVATVGSPISALEHAIRTQPDLIISSTVHDGLTGVDLARALAAISTTNQIPFALLTSFARGHPELSGLPVDAAIIRVGEHFGDDVADVLGRFEIG